MPIFKVGVGSRFPARKVLSQSMSMRPPKAARKSSLRPATRVCNGTPWRLGTVLLDIVLALVSRAARRSMGSKIVQRRAKGIIISVGRRFQGIVVLLMHKRKSYKPRNLDT